MSTKTLRVNEVLAWAAHLPVQERARLAELLIANVVRDLGESLPTPRRSLLGILSDCGPAPSDEDIAEARREMWGNIGEGDDY